MNIYAIPQMIITPFEPNITRTTPPSHFELCAAKKSRWEEMPEGNPFEDKLEQINTAGFSLPVVRAQKHFWEIMDRGNGLTNQVFFGTFISGVALQLVIRIDDLYHHPTDEEDAPPQDATGEDEPPRPAPRCRGCR